MNVDKIENLEQILNVKTILNQKVQRLTVAGENYGSLMLSVDITLENEETLHVVAKLVPPNDLLQRVFNTQVTFINEINFYKTIVPTFQQLQQDQGVTNLIDFFPKYYGNRLNPDGTVGQSAVLLLENLKTQGFVNMERTIGFDFECSKLIIKDLASLHGVGLACKILRPDQFEEKIKPYLTTHKYCRGDREKLVLLIRRLLGHVEEIGSPYFAKVKENFFSYAHLPSREPWATITHNDCWVNNTLIKFDGSKPIKNKLIDFQMCDYASPGNDLVLFMFTSVQNGVCKAHYGDLIDLYYATLLEVLQELKCDTEQFTRKGLEEEISFEAKKSQLIHIGLQLKFIFAPKGTTKELDQISLEDWNRDEPITGLHKEKWIFILEEFGRRDWI